jgi:hypothetical protein
MTTASALQTTTWRRRVFPNFVRPLIPSTRPCPFSIDQCVGTTNHQRSLAGPFPIRRTHVLFSRAACLPPLMPRLLSVCGEECSRVSCRDDGEHSVQNENAAKMAANRREKSGGADGTRIRTTFDSSVSYRKHDTPKPLKSQLWAGEGTYRCTGTEYRRHDEMVSHPARVEKVRLFQDASGRLLGNSQAPVDPTDLAIAQDVSVGSVTIESAPARTAPIGQPTFAEGSPRPRLVT